MIRIAQGLVLNSRVAASDRSHMAGTTESERVMSQYAMFIPWLGDLLGRDGGTAPSGTRRPAGVVNPSESSPPGSCC
jgi:hypothetical protein